MAKFKYIALDKDGRELSGTIDSTSESRARKELSAQGATENQIGAVRIIRKNLIRQIQNEDRRRNTSRLHKVVQAKA